VTLQQTIKNLEGFDRASTIYAVYPWQPSSNAIVARPRTDDRVPDEAVAAGCRYFLEVHIALHLLQQVTRGQNLREMDACARLIEYAELVSSEDKPYPFLKFEFPVNMMIYCRGCGRLFDIVVTGEGSKDYHCPDCGKVQLYDLQAFIRKAVEQTRKMRRKPRGGR
jgi:predicted RNA-binding Zn-ribbon protein involved in translation (DUF1610 family)